MKSRNFLQNYLLARATLYCSTEPATERPTKGIGLKDGTARNNEKINVTGTPVDFKLLSTDTNGDLSVFISSNNRKDDGPPLHVHHKFDEFFCVLEGEFLFQVGDEQTRLNPGDTLFVPRRVNHAFGCVSKQPGKLLVTIQPASHMESFFREMGKLLPGVDSPEHGAPDMGAIIKLYEQYDSAILGPPLRIK